MGRVRQERKRFRDWSLRPAFWAYTLVAFGLATLVCALCVTGLENLRMHSYARDYWDGYREYEIPAGGSYEMWADEDGMHYRILDAGGAEVALAEGDGVTARVTLGYMGETAGDEGGTEPNLIAVVPLMDEQQRTMSVLLTAASILCFPICYGGGAALCLRARVFLSCRLLPLEGQYDTVLVSAHGAILCALFRELLGTPMADFWQGLLPHGGVRAMTVENGICRLLEAPPSVRP